jgi:glycosyltransferase involved in cell wall biosynthesis
VTDRVVHVVLPDGVRDPARPSGGNRYDVRLCDGLRARGWTVHEHEVTGSWPHPDDTDLATLATVRDRLPDGALVLVDGLVGSAAAEVLVPATDRLVLVVLVHLPRAAVDPAVTDAEGRVLRAARAVVATSDWSRDRLRAWYGVPATVARPGVDPAPVTVPSVAGNRLLCVAPVTRAKGFDVLVDALGEVADLDWTCTVVGRLDVEPDTVADVTRRADAAGIAGRLLLTGPAAGSVASSYGSADLVLLPSRLETYGMVVTEALAHGIPVVGSDVGGLPEALGRTRLGLPGALVPAGDAAALAEQLRGWLTDPSRRDGWRATAALRRGALADWSATAAVVAGVLDAATEPSLVLDRPPG